MSKIKLLLLLMIGLHLFRSNAQEVESTTYNWMLKALLSHTVKEINVKEAVEKNEALFVDSREKEEYEVSHIKDAVFVGYNNLKLKPLNSIEKSREIIVYCSVGYRSEKVAEKLFKMGFTDVKNLYGGIFEWKNQGFPVWNDAEETEKVHAYDKKWGIWLKKGEKVY